MAHRQKVRASGWSSVSFGWWEAGCKWGIIHIKVNIMDSFCSMCNLKKNPQQHSLTFRNACYLIFLSLLSLFNSAGLIFFFPWKSDVFVCLIVEMKTLAWGMLSMILCIYFLGDFTLLPLSFHLFCAAEVAQKLWKRVQGLAQYCLAHTRKNWLKIVIHFPVYKNSPCFVNSAHSKCQYTASVTSVDIGQINKDFDSEGCILCAYLVCGKNQLLILWSRKEGNWHLA